MARVEPYDWQVRDLDLLEAHGFVGLVNVEMGGGKTLLALWAAERAGARRVLVVAPEPTFQSAWMPSVRDVLGVEARVIGGTGKARKEALFDFVMGFDGVFLCTPQFLTRADISEWSGDMVIVDEGHLLNSRGTAGQRKLSGTNDKEWEVSLSARFPMRLFLSGTAWRNSFERAWATMRFLWPGLSNAGEVAYSNYWGWLFERMTSEEIFTGQRDGFGRPKKVKRWLNETVPGRLVSEAPCVVIHKRRERCCDAHPNGFLEFDAPRVSTHVVELLPAQKRIIRELEDSYMAWLDDNPLVTELSLTQQQRIRQVCLGVPRLEEFDVVGDDGEVVVKQTLRFDDDCRSPLADEMIELLRELDESEPVVIFLESQRFAEVLTRRLNREGFAAFEFSGRTVKTREADLREFGRKFRVLVGVLSAVSTGVDSIQRVCRTEFWAESSVDLTVNIQAQGRADRIGGVGQVDRHYFVDSEGYADGRMSDQLVKRLALAATLRKV